MITETSHQVWENYVTILFKTPRLKKTTCGVLQYLPWIMPGKGPLPVCPGAQEMEFLWIHDEGRGTDLVVDSCYILLLKIVFQTRRKGLKANDLHRPWSNGHVETPSCPKFM